MRVKYEVDMNKITGMIESLGGVNKISRSEYEIVWIGYIIKYNLIDYFLKSKEIYYECEPYACELVTDYPELKDFNKFYGKIPTTRSLTKEAIHWLQIGTDFMLTNYREYTIQTFLQRKEGFTWNKENKVMKQYVFDNKEEFPEAYLDLML